VTDLKSLISIRWSAHL